MRLLFGLSVVGLSACLSRFWQNDPARPHIIRDWFYSSRIHLLWVIHANNCVLSAVGVAFCSVLVWFSRCNQSINVAVYHCSVFNHFSLIAIIITCTPLIIFINDICCYLECFKIMSRKTSVWLRPKCIKCSSLSAHELVQLVSSLPYDPRQTLTLTSCSSHVSCW